MLKEWMFAFNEAKEAEANGEEGMELIRKYECVIAELGDGPYTEAEEHVLDEVRRNLYELYTLNGDEAKAEEYNSTSSAC